MPSNHDQKDPIKHQTCFTRQTFVFVIMTPTISTIRFLTWNSNLVFFLSNGHSPANLSNSSTRQNGLFRKLVGLAKFAHIHQPVLLGLARLVDICHTILRGLARLGKGKFGKCYANLANLASLVNLGSVG
jgi:hypothetical protein